MFGLPDAKRVRRSDLFTSRSQSPSSASESGPYNPNRSKERPVLGPETVHPQTLELDVDIKPPHANPVTQAACPQQPQSAAFEFRLFSQPSKATAHLNQTSADPQAPTSTFITVRTPTPDPEAAAGHFAQPSRPLAYYLTAAHDDDTKQRLQSRYATTAVSGYELLNESKRVWPGTCIPWRVTHLPIPRPSKVLKTRIHRVRPVSDAEQRPTHGSQRKCKPSKKRRIILRSRLRAKVASASAKEATEAEEREKRTRRNREKKVKRKKREKEKKANQSQEQMQRPAGTPE